MKKLLLTVALLFATSLLFAQVNEVHNPLSGNVALTPAPAKALCDGCLVPQIARQFHPGLENVSDVHQRGIDNIANVLQLGLGNYSMINQDGDDANGMGGLLNVATVYQAGDHNYSDIDQKGDKNNGKVIQMGDLNYASQVVGVGFAEDNIAYVNQDGTSNASSQTQLYDNNEARIEQDGTNNEATQYQSSGPNDQASGSYASIIQNGSDNKVSQRQIGSLNDAQTEQRGNRNSSVEVQNAGSYAFLGLTNTSRVLQVGDDNTNCLTQTEGTTGWNYNYVYQFGNFNHATVNQTANSLGSNMNDSAISQLGNGNTACVEQHSFSGSN